MLLEKFRDAGDKVRVDRITVIVETDEDIRRASGGEFVARRDGAEGTLVNQQANFRMAGTEPFQRAISTAIDGDQNFIRRRIKPGKHLERPRQVFAAIVGRDGDGAGRIQSWR